MLRAVSLLLLLLGVGQAHAKRYNTHAKRCAPWMGLIGALGSGVETGPQVKRAQLRGQEGERGVARLPGLLSIRLAQCHSHPGVV